VPGLQRLQLSSPFGRQFSAMNKLSRMSAMVALLVAGCHNLKTENQPSGLPLRYCNSQYGLTFFLPSSWRGYSALTQQWDTEMYLPATDKTIVVGHGTMITLRHPQWTAGQPYQDIPIFVFTRVQWDDLNHGKLWPSLLAGGIMDELWHNDQYVFGMSSRYNWVDDLIAQREVAETVHRNLDANKMLCLYPH
jgi:hypothetical protein